MPPSVCQDVILNDLLSVCRSTDAKGGNSGEHSCAASLVNHGNCSFLTEFNIIKAQQEKRRSAASGGSSPGVVISISASSGRNSTILMNVCFSICWEAYSSHYVFFVFFQRTKMNLKGMSTKCRAQKCTVTNPKVKDLFVEQHKCHSLTKNLNNHNFCLRANHEIFHP